MDAKLTITTKCGAWCATCPCWQEPERTMSYDKFVEAWAILNAAPEVTRILINNVGDVNDLPNKLPYLKMMENRCKPVIMTTNANKLDYVPMIDVMVISFNGGTKEAYEKTTGLNFEHVVSNIRNAYPELKKISYVELDCLIWEGNKGTEKALGELWADFPGRVRLGYKVENQGRKYFGVEGYKDDKRIPCDYLGILNVAPSGRVISCAHDFHEEIDFGNIFETPIHELLKNKARLAKIEEHNKGMYTGLCEKCNYNVTTEGKFVYIK